MLLQLLRYSPLCFCLCLLGVAETSQAQDSLNMEKLYQWDDDSLPTRSGGSYSDCWGYTDEEGREYAILGGIHNIFFFDITDPNNVVLVEEFGDGSPAGLDLDPTIWRDFKTYGEKAYAVADEFNEGLLVFDLSGLPDTVILEEQNTSFFLRSHNIFIDTARGYLYTAGANTQSAGTIILDLNTDPISEVASVDLDGGYIHDLHVYNDTAYCNSGNDGLYIFDFTTPSTPDFLGSFDGYANEGYNHSCWLTEDKQHLVFCDENLGRQVKICDVSNPASVSIDDFFYSDLLGVGSPASMAHNPFVLGDYVYIAYYHDGVQVYDISDPTNVVSHAYYDTAPENTAYSGFLGCWGVYPYFPSGSIIASDDNNGLFVLRLTLGALPVEWTSFTAAKKEDRVQLNWSTASETQSSHYEVQHSTDGTNFENIGRVDAAGTVTTSSQYDFEHRDPNWGTNYYRLRQVDLDGKENYSEVRTIEYQGASVLILPTLVKKEMPLQVQLPQGSGQIKIFLSSGQLFREFTANDYQVDIPTTDWQNGTYVFQISTGGEVITQKVLVAR